MNPDDRHAPFIIGILLVLTFVLYGKSLLHYFMLDDTTAIFAGYLLSHDPAKIFTYNFDVIYMSALWRYVVALSYIPNFLLSGDSAWSYHLVSLLLHFANGVIVYYLIRKLSGDGRLSALIALLFTVSLNKADAVMMVAHRTTLLGAFFGLLSLYCYMCILRDGFSWKKSAALAMAFAAALGSYETTLVLPGVFVLGGLIYKGRQFFTRSILCINAVAVATVVLLVVFLRIGSGNVIRDTGIMEKAVHILRNIMAVIPSLVVPPSWLPVDNTTYYNAVLTFGVLEWSGIAFVSLIFLAYWKTREPLLLFGLVIFVIIAVPTATTRWIYYPEPTSAYHRMRFSIGKYSYFSSLGYFVILGCFAHAAYLRIQARFPRQLAVFTSLSIMTFYIVFNGAFIAKREKDWAAVTATAREQMTQLKKLNLQIGPDASVFVSGFCNYGRHAQAHMRVLYDNSELRVREAAEYTGASGNDLFVVASRMGVIATTDVAVASRIARSQ